MTRCRLALTLGALVLAGVWIHGCLRVPQIPAHGTLAGYSLSGPVDSELARRYMQGRALPDDFERTRRRLLADGRVPTRRKLIEISRRYSPDVATLLFIEAVAALPANQALRQRFEAEVQRVRRVGMDRAKPEVPDDLVFLLVPGWFYEANGHETNGDYHIQRRLYEAWGVPHRLAPIDENGTVQDNATVVADAIRETSTTHQVFVVSASKSGAEVALALGRELGPGELDRVVGWLSIGGVVRGSPLADRVLEPDLCWLAQLKLGMDGFDLRGLKSMQTEGLRGTFDAFRFPDHIRILSYVPVPLSGHISDRGSFGYHRMRDLGPNDGLTLLVDELVPGATTLLAPGVDHFLGSQDQNVLSAAFLRTVLAH